MGVMGGRGRELVDARGEQVGPVALGAPGGEARGQALLGLGLVDCLLQPSGVRPVDEDAGVGRLELILDGRAAAWHGCQGWAG